MSNWEHVVGHEWAVQMLSAAIQNGRIGHAYLFTGPDHIGKTTLAKTFAQAVNCREPDAPCGGCRTCQLIDSGRHMDMRLVEPEVSGRGKLTLKIDTIRQLQQDLQLSAYEARYKVAIINRFDAATDGAANAFLKTLEEPPRNVILMLTATDADTLLSTISSRCRTINLRPLSIDQIEQALTTRWQVPQETATLLAHLSDGRLGWAVDAAQDASILATRSEQLNWLHEAVQGRLVDRFSLAEKLSRKQDTLPDLLQTWLSWWRDATVLAQYADPLAAPVTLSNLDENGRLREFAARWPADQVLNSLKHTHDALWQLERNANTRLVMENLLMTYPRQP